MEKGGVMHKIKTMLMGLCLMMPMVFSTGCSMPSDGEEGNLTLSKTSIELTVGESERLRVSTRMDETILWESSNEEVAVVDDGVVTAKSEGEAKVTAKTNGKSVSCDVKVKSSEKKD